MDNLLIAIEAVLPLLIFMVLGWVLNKSSLISKLGFEQINLLLFNVVIPILIFRNLYNADLASIWNSGTIIYILIYLVLCFFLFALLVKIVEKDNLRRSVMLQGITRSSAVLFGLPLATNLLGVDNLGTVSVAATLSVPFNSIFPVLCFTLFNDYEASWKQSFKKIFTNPIMIAAILGLLIQLLPLEFPEFLHKSINQLANISTPLAFILIGGTFQFKALKRFDASLWFTVLSRNLIVPVLGLTIAYFLGIRNQNMIAVLVATAGPTAVVSYSQALAAKADAELANNIVVYTTLIAIFSMTLFIYLLIAIGAINI